MRLRHIAGPGQRLDDDAVNAEMFLLCVAGVVVVQPHRARRGEGGSKEDEKRRDGKQQVFDHGGKRKPKAGSQ